MFTKNLDTVLKGLSNTLDQLQIVADQQQEIAFNQSAVIAEAKALRDDADETQARALRISLKLADLLA